MGRGLSGTWVGVCEWVYVTGGVDVSGYVWVAEWGGG